MNTKAAALTKQVQPMPMIILSHEYGCSKNHTMDIQIGRQNPQLNGLVLGSQIGLA